MSKRLSSELCGFRKNCNTQYSLIYMLEKWKGGMDKSKYMGAFLWISQKLLAQ